VTDTIHQAKKQILVQAYSFTSPAIAKALTDAKARGVDVEVILDKSQWMEEGNGLKSNPVGNRYNPKWEWLEHVDEAQG
jgi:phosphatidylserine/phosphatidylglycerophosphate/cardiolipin synthase-like enzyme